MVVSIIRFGVREIVLLIWFLPLGSLSWVSRFSVLSLGSLVCEMPEYYLLHRVVTGI